MSKVKRIEDEAREWAKLQKRRPSRVCESCAFFRRVPDANRFLVTVMAENDKGGEASWDSIHEYMTKRWRFPNSPSALRAHWLKHVVGADA